MIIRDPERLTIPPDGQPPAAQPRWRQDFPIDWAQDNYITRRDFTRFMVLISLAFTVGQFWILLQNFFRVRRGALSMLEIGQADQLAVGGSLIFHYPDEQSPAILVRLSETTFVAYDQQCTHLTCPVIPQPDASRLHCPCHEGVFDLLTGQPLAGPPRRPLPKIKLERRGDRLYAIGLEEETL
jgi:nitrite reductase/ring-hydroxylating ferredoxin subunit